MKKQKIIKIIDIFILILALLCLVILIVVHNFAIDFPSSLMMLCMIVIYTGASGIKQIFWGNKKIGVYLIAFSIFVFVLYGYYQMMYYRLK